MGSYQFYGSEDEFAEVLSRREEHTERVPQVRISDFRFSDGSSLNLGTMTSAQAECLFSGTGLFMTFSTSEGKEYADIPVRDSAMASLSDRIGLAGTAVSRMQNDRQAMVMDYAAECNSPDRLAQIIMVDGMVNAVLSDDNTRADAVVFPLIEVFQEYMRYIWSDISPGGIVSFSGWHGYDGIEVRLLLPQETELDGFRYRLETTLATSDIGQGAVCIGAGLCGNGRTVPLIDPIRTVHRKTSDINMIFESCSMLASGISEGMLRAEHLKDIWLNWPVDAMRRFSKKARLPKRLVMKVTDAFDMAHPGEGATALDCYTVLSEIPVLYGTGGASPVWERRLRSNLCKAVSADWQEYDMPGFSW